MAEWREEAIFETLNRAGQASCVWGTQLLVFGGRTTSTFFTDAWAFDTVAGTWELLAERTPPWFAARRCAAPRCRRCRRCCGCCLRHLAAAWHT